MKEIIVPKWECEHCGEVFDTPGCELNCALENKGKKCRFEKEEVKDGHHSVGILDT